MSLRQQRRRIHGHSKLNLVVLTFPHIGTHIVLDHIGPYASIATFAIAEIADTLSECYISTPAHCWTSQLTLILTERGVTEVKTKAARPPGEEVSYQPTSYKNDYKS